MTALVEISMQAMGNAGEWPLDEASMSDRAGLAVAVCENLDMMSAFRAEADNHELSPYSVYHFPTLQIRKAPEE